MLTFKQPADAVLSAYFREHKSSAGKTATKLPKPPSPPCAIIKNQCRPAPSACPAAQSRACRTRPRQKHKHQPNQRPVRRRRNRVSAASTQNRIFRRLHTAAELPQWLVEQLQNILATEKSSPSAAASTAALLDIRVNTLKGRRDKVLPLLQAESPDAEATPYSWGIRLKTKSPSTNTNCFRRYA